MANPRLLNGAASVQSVYETSTTQRQRIGARGQLDDRIFRYARLTNSTGVVANNLCAGPAQDAAHEGETGAVTSSVSGLNGPFASGLNIGATAITATLGATAAHTNMFEDGYFKVENSTLGKGQIYKVKGHASVLASGVITLGLYDPVVTTVTGTLTWTLIQNPWADIIIAPVTTSVSMAVGVNLVAIPGATTDAPVYSWVQTWGVTSVLMDTSALVLGSQVIQSVVAAGSIGVQAGILQPVGIALLAETADTLHASIFLTIAP